MDFTTKPGKNYDVFYGSKFDLHLCEEAQLTYRGHLRDASHVRTLQELRLVVIDVLDLDDERGLGFESFSCKHIHSLRLQHVVRLFLTVQAPQGMDVSGGGFDSKNRTDSFSRQRVLHQVISSIQVTV